MRRADIEARLEGFVRSQFSVSPGDPGFDRKSDLFDQGYVDSVGAVEMLEFIAHAFDVEIPEVDLVSDEFATIEGIAQIVDRLAQQQGAEEEPSRAR